MLSTRIIPQRLTLMQSQRGYPHPLLRTASPASPSAPTLSPRKLRVISASASPMNGIEGPNHAPHLMLPTSRLKRPYAASPLYRSLKMRTRMRRMRMAPRRSVTELVPQRAAVEPTTRAHSLLIVCLPYSVAGWANRRRLHRQQETGAVQYILGPPRNARASSVNRSSWHILPEAHLLRRMHQNQLPTRQTTTVRRNSTRCW